MQWVICHRRAPITPVIQQMGKWLRVFAQEKQSALAIYDINGGLPIAYCHGFIEAFCEIVCSGEL